MIAVRETSVFAEWMLRLPDSRARARITRRIDRLAAGNPGEWKSVGQGIRELRVDYGPGYRVYFMQRGDILIVLLCGGDKRSQRQDIARARRLAESWKD